jgi:hypothetical protein
MNTITLDTSFLSGLVAPQHLTEDAIAKRAPTSRRTRQSAASHRVFAP